MRLKKLVDGGNVVRIAAVAVADRARDIRRRPGISRQQGCSHRIQGLTPGRDIGLRLRNHRRIGHAALACLRSGFALSFIVEIEKCLVLDDRPAQRTRRTGCCETDSSAPAMLK